MPPRGGRVCPPGASRPALWASSAGGLQPPDPQGLRAPLWPLNASTGPLRPVWQVGGAAWAPVASESLYGPLVTCSAGLGVFVEIQKFVVEARRGGQVPDRRSRPSTAAGGGRGACPRLPRPGGGAHSAGGGWGAPACGGDRGQSPLVGILSPGGTPGANQRFAWCASYA